MPIGRRCRWLCAGAALAWSAQVLAGAQQYQPLAAGVRAAMRAVVADGGEPPEPRFESSLAKVDWLSEMSHRLAPKIPSERARMDFLLTLYYEAQRSGLDPQLVLGLIQVESNFRRVAVSRARAIGYMQVMPFWTSLLGDGDPGKLFHMRINLRYGCTILRHYLDIEKGNLYRALGRYNGSLGRPEYPNAVLAAWKKWQYTGPAARGAGPAQKAPEGVPASQ
jgi:soluble lytic murein transglycosylase-like protein